MAISKFTDEELSGIGIGPLHGVAMARLNALIDRANANEASIAASALEIDNTVDAVITAEDVADAGTDSDFTLQLNGLDGNPIAKAAVVKIIAADSEYGGANDANANVTFATATAGSILASGSGWAVVKTSAAGAFACTVANSADETVYFTAADSDGGVDAVASGVVVRGCAPVSATWAA